VDEVPLPLLAFGRPDMSGHGCFDACRACEPDCAIELPLVLAAPDELDPLAACCALAVTEWVTAGDALVDALAMVRPRPRLAPRAPAAIAAPASGREILMLSPLAVVTFSGAGRPRAGHQWRPVNSVRQLKLCYRWRPVLRRR
jgi:hypothetical protein